ncbi:hypothetical protein DL93DRAFT_2154593 [Clavulina sp. PMI_390]|nr:hypothetical protein DL93DRAFT_2154593 [Clavulina sp. PMI_390]
MIVFPKPFSSTVLDRGAACLQCRKQKIKCDGLKPTCSRCHRLYKNCAYSASFHHRPIADALIAQNMNLEIGTHKMAMSPAHNLFLLSKKLRERIGRLGTPSQRNKMATFPSSEGNLARRLGDSTLSEEIDTEDLYTIQKSVEQELRSLELSELEALPLSLSIRLINLLLPFRGHYYFLVDISHFARCVSLPPSHPDSIHPCLLNICYLAACASNGDGLAQFKPYFLERTRRFIQQSLMFADRIPHFLWAQGMLVVFYLRERRMVEALTTAGALSSFTSACGVTLPDPGHSASENNDSSANEILLPPPKNEVEADDRIRFAHTMYIGYQTFSQLCGAPQTYPFEWWSPLLREISLKFQDDKTSVNPSELWRLEVYVRVLCANTFERVMEFARSVMKNGRNGREQEYLAIATQISEQQKTLSSLYDPNTLQDVEASGVFNLNFVLGYVTLHGSGVVLHSLWAFQRPQSRTQILACLQGLVDIYGHARNHQRPHVNLHIVHIMNALRIIAQEVRRADTREDTRLCLSYYLFIEWLLDFLDDTMAFLPAWVEVLSSLKDPLTAAIDSLTA